MSSVGGWGLDEGGGGVRGRIEGVWGSSRPPPTPPPAV